MGNSKSLSESKKLHLRFPWGSSLSLSLSTHNASVICPLAITPFTCTIASIFASGAITHSVAVLYVESKLFVLRSAIQCLLDDDNNNNNNRLPNTRTPRPLHVVDLQPWVTFVPPQRHAYYQQTHLLPPHAIPAVWIPRSPHPNHLQALSLGDFGPLAELQR